MKETKGYYCALFCLVPSPLPTPLVWLKPLDSRALDQLPPSLLIYAIEGKNFAAASGLSIEVEKAVREVVERVTREVQHHLNVTNPIMMSYKSTSHTPRRGVGDTSGP
jgi:hypothetical protein